MRSDAILLVLGVIGIILGFLPIYIVNGTCPVTFIDYCQGEVPVYIDIFEKLRMTYIPLLFSSIVLLIVGVLGLSKAELPVDVKMPIVVGYTFALIPALTMVSVLKEGVVSYEVSLKSAYVKVTMCVKYGLGYYILNLNGVSPLFLIALSALAYYVIEIAFKVLRAKYFFEESVNKRLVESNLGRHDEL